MHFNRMTRAAMWTSDCESGKTEVETSARRLLPQNQVSPELEDFKTSIDFSDSVGWLPGVALWW